MGGNSNLKSLKFHGLEDIGIKTKIKDLKPRSYVSTKDIWNNATRYEKKALIVVLYYYGREGTKRWKRWVNTLTHLQFEDLDRFDQDFLVEVHNARVKRLEAN